MLKVLDLKTDWIEARTCHDLHIPAKQKRNPKVPFNITQPDICIHKQADRIIMKPVEIDDRPSK